jgi:hypothetical protein
MSDKPSKNTHATRTAPKYPTKDTRGQFHAQLVIERMAVRCKTCGGRVIQPCRLCMIRGEL